MLFRSDGGREDTPTPQEQVKNSPLGLASLVASFPEIFSETPQQKNDWKKRMLATQKGITFPDNWDTLSEEEKQVLGVAKAKSKSSTKIPANWLKRVFEDEDEA